MTSLLDEFYLSQKLDDLLDDQLVLDLIKCETTVLTEFLKSHQDLVGQMITLFQFDEFETDHKIIIKYPYVASEILGQLDVLQDCHIIQLIEQFNCNTELPAIIIGYYCKLFMNLLKHQPAKIWELLNQQQINHILQYLDYETIQEVMYSMIIFQTTDNHMQFIEMRENLLIKIIDNIQQFTDGVANIISMLLESYQDNIQEQKIVFANYLINNIELFIQLLPKYPRQTSKIMISFLKQKIQPTMVQTIQDGIFKQIPQIVAMISDENNTSPHFGLDRLSLLQLLLAISEFNDINTVIIEQEILDQLIGLFTKYPLNNRVHLIASDILINCEQIISNNDKYINKIADLIKQPTQYRGYVLKLLNKLLANRISCLDAECQLIFDNLNTLNNTYLLNQMPEIKPVYNLHEEFENAMSKLQDEQYLEEQ